MVPGILQFTPSIAFRYVLHRCESRDIRCRESFSLVQCEGPPPQTPFLGLGRRSSDWISLARPAPGVWLLFRGHEGAKAPPVPSYSRNWFSGRSGGRGFDNDPSAGSPTETLLRLLLPLNDKVQ